MSAQYKRPPWIWIGLIIAVLSASSCQVLESAAQRSADTIGTQTTREEPLTASGTIQAEEIRIASELGGRIVEVRVEMGAETQAGEVVVVLDATPLVIRLAEMEAEMAVVQADLAVVKAGPRVEEIAAAQAALALSEAQRDGAHSAWENALQAVENPQELDAQIAEARTQVKLAEQGVELAEAELAREQLLREQRQEGSVERQVADFQVKAAEDALAAANADLKTSQTLLNWLWIIRNEPLGLIAQAHVTEGQYRVAEAEAAVAQARLDDLLAGPTSDEIAVAQAAVDLAKAKAAALRSQQAKFTLISPVDGVVLDQPLRVGEVAAPAATILTVADLSELTLVLYVPENRIGQVQVGQAVQMTVDSFPDRAFTGRVRHIGDEPEFTPRNIATKEERLNTFFAVDVHLPNEDGLLKPGMPADATFHR